MAEKTTDPYYDRLEAQIDRFLRLIDLVPAERIVMAFAHDPAKMGTLLGALYRARAISRPGGLGRAELSTMSDSQLQDAIIQDLREQGYEVTKIEPAAVPEPEPDRIVPIKRGVRAGTGSSDWTT